MNHEIFQTLASLEAEKKALEAQIAIVRSQVQEELTNNELDRLEAEYGTFYLSKRKKWTYTDKVTTKEKALKALKKKEEESGVAQVEEVTSLNYRPVKD